MPDTQFLEWTNNLLTCFCEALAQNPNPPAVCCLTWGDPIADISVEGQECCDGAAYVRMLEYYPSSNLFPDRTIERQSGPCGVLAWALRLELTIFRCWPTGTIYQSSTCAEKTAATEQLYHDAQAMRTAMCCFRTLARQQGLLVAVTDTTPIDPGGGCAGLQGSISIQLPNCDQC